MKETKRVFIVGMGIISPLGIGIHQTLDSIKLARKGIGPLTIFSSHKQVPVGEIKTCPEKETNIPRTHQLALIAAKEAMAGIHEIPQAIVMGSTTGGILTTENLIKEKNTDVKLYQYHAVHTVAEYLAQQFHCEGPVISVSTACSSGTTAIAVATALLRSGVVSNVLVGGADSLCRLTYYGFYSLQIVDPSGARPFDKHRKGMTVSEGAGMLFLKTAVQVPENAIAEIIGYGLSCDAYHVTAPHPDGKGAYQAMMTALQDANISPHNIDYINLHGTGTIDNDLSEAKALQTLWHDRLPPVSSIKGAFGHSMAASGAIEAIITALCISQGFIPANEGFQELDPTIHICPVRKSIFNVPVNIALSNSFGFGGNNASIVLRMPSQEGKCSRRELNAHEFSVIENACFTGAGDTLSTVTTLVEGKPCIGTVDISNISDQLPIKQIRRIKRLQRMTLALAASVCQNSPDAIFLGTGWGSLSETFDFLIQLYDSDEKFASPTDFVGSVHNAAAGQTAILLKTTGPNITTTVGNYSFDHALFLANVMIHQDDETVLVIGADEFHPSLTPLLDPLSVLDNQPSDGGGALYLTKKNTVAHKGKLRPIFFSYVQDNSSVLSTLITKLGGARVICDRYDALFVGIPKAFYPKASEQFRQFLSKTGFSKSIMDYRKFIGEFASASAIATVIALRFLENETIPYPFYENSSTVALKNKRILLLNLGNYVTAIEVYR